MIRGIITAHVSHTGRSLLPFALLGSIGQCSLLSQGHRLRNPEMAERRYCISASGGGSLFWCRHHSSAELARETKAWRRRAWVFVTCRDSF